MLVGGREVFGELKRQNGSWGDHYRSTPTISRDVTKGSEFAGSSGARGKFKKKS